MEVKMNDLTLARIKHVGLFEGRYRLRQPLVCHTRDGKQFARMYLEDINGTIPAYIWQPDEDIPLVDLSCVQVEGVIRLHEKGAVVDVKQVIPAPKFPEDVIRLIPRSLCPLLWQMPLLESILDSIQLPWLKQFVMEVLSEDAISFPFVACPASLRYHHKYPGGLLRHSIESTQIIERYEEFPAEKKELGMVAALFHDIGKVRTMTPEMKRTALGKAMDHDKLTLEVLAPYLGRLDATHPVEAAELRYIMTWRPGKQDYGIPKTPLANAVLAADRISAGVDNKEKPTGPFRKFYL
jgi:3'-5' exoribonuclease